VLGDQAAVEITAGRIAVDSQIQAMSRLDVGGIFLDALAGSVVTSKMLKGRLANIDLRAPAGDVTLGGGINVTEGSIFVPLRRPVVHGLRRRSDRPRHGDRHARGDDRAGRLSAGLLSERRLPRRGRPSAVAVPRRSPRCLPLPVGDVER
jgi:hypothetical protein